MKDLISKLLALLPAYASQLIDLVSDPKKFVANKNLASVTAINEALVFLGISIALAFVAQIPLLPEKQDKELMFLALAVQSALAFAMNIAILVLSWKIVGGQVGWKHFIAVTCYFSSVSTLLFLAFYLLAFGAFNVLDPVHSKQLLTGSAMDWSELVGSLGAKVGLIILGGGFIAMYAWIFYVWGAYRQLNRLSKLRSGMAFAIFVTLSPFPLLAEGLMAASTVPVNQAQTPTLPASLVGGWQTTRKTRSDGVTTVESIRYKFFENGGYFRVSVTGSTDGRCTKQVSQEAFGRMAVEGSTLVFTPSKSTESTKEGCSEKKSESSRPLELNKEADQYQIRQQTSGQELCLAGRQGELCLTPDQQ
jgi:hypothetical protein